MAAELPGRDWRSGLAVLRLLADGERHSGRALGDTLGISRAAVWKRLKRLERFGLDVDARRGAGYRLRRPVELLSRDSIAAALDERTHRVIERLEVATVLDSTNSFLLTAQRPTPGRLAVCFAEYQTGGRGRRGRAWLSPLGRGLCLSVAWVFGAQPGDLAALGLAAGVVARRALSRSTALPIRIKWPNDLLVDDRKIGGVLVESSAESHGPCFVVIGIGVNVSATPSLIDGSGAWADGATDLAAASGGAVPSRNALGAAIVDELAALLEAYSATGFAPYHGELVDADYLVGRSIRVAGAGRDVSGRAIGIGPHGALLVEAAGGVTEVLCGDVSVRPKA